MRRRNDCCSSGGAERPTGPGDGDRLVLGELEPSAGVAGRARGAEEEWDDGAYLVDPEGRSPGRSFLRVPEAKAGKNRLHLDLQVSGGRSIPAPARTNRIEATRVRLEAAGATVLARHEQGGRLDHLVLADSEGNEFCEV